MIFNGLKKNFLKRTFLEQNFIQCLCRPPFLLPIILELIGIYPKKKSVGPRGHSTTTWTEICHFFTPPPLRGQFLYPERGQKQTFLTPSPPHLVHVVIEWPLPFFFSHSLTFTDSTEHTPNLW